MSGYVDDTRLASTTILPMLYERRNFRLAWTNPDTIDQLITAIQDIDQDGLNPADYHLAAVRRLRARITSSMTPDPAQLVDLDLLLTDSLIRLDYHIRFGKINPEALDSNWNLTRGVNHDDSALLIQQAIDTNAVGQYLENAKPKHVFYTRFKAALARYRAIQRQGAWESVPAGPVLKPGMSDARVIVLRQRLTVTGGVAEQPSNPQPSDSMLFDEPLKQAVIQFQARHGLAEDGVVGKDTLQALNVPVEDRIAQIRVNLERARWALHEIKGDFVLVDIAGFRAIYMRDDAVVWTSKVQVGKPYRKTPVFKSAIRYLVLNPAWTVPPVILAEDILPVLKRNPGYLREQGFTVIDRNGKTVDPAGIDWRRYTASNFPYQLRQEPGPDNALGRIKFVFPNPYLIFLHDTPRTSLFQHANRAFSSGCIRVQEPFELATLLLNDPVKWDRESLMQAIASKRTQTVFLPRPVPVLLLYWTVGFDDHGKIRFERDIYNRDQAVLTGLEGAFTFRKRPNKP